MKKYYVLIIATLFIISSCSNLTDQEIKFEKWILKIELPEQYKSYNYEQLDEFLKSTNVEVATYIIGSYLKQLMYNKEMQVVIDSTSIFNCISINGFDQNITIDPKFLRPVGDMVTLKLTQQYKKVGGDVEPVNGVVRNGEHYRYMKLKYKLTVGEKNYFFANYLISLKEKTIVIGVLNEIDQDFEDVISKIAIYNIKEKPE